MLAQHVEIILSLAALLNPIGCAKAAVTFRGALERKKTVADMVLERKLLSPQELDRLFDPGPSRAPWTEIGGR